MKKTNFLNSRSGLLLYFCCLKKKNLKSRPVIIIISGCSPGLLSAQTWRLRGHLLVICEPPLQKLKVNFHLFAGSVGKNLASKPNVYVSSSAGARWREVSMVERSRRHSSLIKPTDVFKVLLSAAKSFKYFNVKKSPFLLKKNVYVSVMSSLWQDRISTPGGTMVAS